LCWHKLRDSVFYHGGGSFTCAAVYLTFSLRILVLSATRVKESEGLPDSIIKRVETESFPNEYPGQIYAFNWC
jgi:hypothetical protein